MDNPDTVTLPPGWRLKTCSKQPPDWAIWVAVLQKEGTDLLATGEGNPDPIDAIREATKYARLADGPR